jgi:hypothetical protein
MRYNVQIQERAVWRVGLTACLQLGAEQVCVQARQRTKGFSLSIVFYYEEEVEK